MGDGVQTGLQAGQEEAKSSSVGPGIDRVREQFNARPEGGVVVSGFNADAFIRSAELERQARYQRADLKGKAAKTSDESELAMLNEQIEAQENFIRDMNALQDGINASAAAYNEFLLKTPASGFVPGSLGYDSYGFAIMPSGPFSYFTPAGAPMMPEQMPSPQLRENNGSFEIVGPDGSIIHTYANAELLGQLTPQQRAQFELTQDQRESIKQFEQQREKARKEIEEVTKKLQGANASNLSEEQKKALLKQASDAQKRYNEATKELNSIQGVKLDRLGSFTLENAKDQREHAQRSEAQLIKFYQDWLKDEREFNQKRVQEFERMQRDLFKGDHEMLRRVAQRQMEQDIRNNAGWVRTYQQIYSQWQRAQIQNWTDEQRFARNEIAQDNRVFRKNFLGNALGAASRILIGGLFSRITGSLFGDDILRAQNRDYNRVVRSNQQRADRLARQNNRQGNGGALWGK